MKKMICLLFTALSLFCTNAQPTGDFVLGFPSPDTLLTKDSVLIYFHVPSNYQPGTPAKLIIGLHGLGNPQTPQQIRQYLTHSADSMGAILACPEPYLQDQPRSRLVVNLTIDSILSWFDIDTNEIYITGYSAGSDIAAQYLLDSPKHAMKGLIWFAPGFFYEPNLSEQAVFPPTCLCWGTSDVVSNILGQVNAIRDSFENSSFDFFFNEIPGVAHTMDFPGFTDEFLECVRFIENPLNFEPNPVTSIKKPENSRFDIKQDYSSNSLYISVLNDNSEKLNLRVFKITGQGLDGSRISHSTGFQFSVNMANLPNGIYVVVVENEKGVYSRKISW